MRSAGAGVVPALVIGLAARLATAAPAGTPVEPPAEFLRGADVTALDRLDVRGAAFADADGGAPRAALGILEDAGFDVLQLTVLVDPETGYLGTSRSAAMAGRIKGAGFGLLLQLRAADAEDGPRAVEIPRRWADRSDEELVKAVRTYAAGTVRAFGEMGGRPDFLRVGEDLSHGFLGDRGRVGPDSSAAAWDRFAALAGAMLEGARAAAPRARTVLPLAQGDAAWCAAVVDSLAARDVRFDLLGVVWLPWYRGTLTELTDLLAALSLKHPGRVLVLETAYPWTLRGFDGTLDEVGQPSQLHPGYPATPEGQAAWLADVIAAAREAGSAGVFWGDAVSIAARGVGSSRENLALFDDGGRALPALTAGR